MSRQVTTHPPGRATGADGLVREFIDAWVALSGDAWLALGGGDDVRRSLAEAVTTLAPDRGPECLRRVVAWATPELASLDLPRLLEDLGCEYVPWTVEAAGSAGDDDVRTPATDATTAGMARLRDLAATSNLGITTCAWAVAETGTIALLATPTTGRLPSLLPSAQLALVRPSQIVKSIPDGLRFLAEYAAQHGDLPSVVNLVSGPSRSADIEGDLVVGVHGPGRAGVIIGDW
jgi:hypothetical protein